LFNYLRVWDQVNIKPLKSLIRMVSITSPSMRTAALDASQKVPDSNKSELEPQVQEHVIYSFNFIDNGNEKLALNKTGSYF
jgi:hypothetical protein